jgi:hypothetical protein
VRRLWRGRDDLEARLCALRNEPRPGYVNELRHRHEQLRSRHAGVRFALALGLTAALLLLLAAVGGVAYATSVVDGVKAPVKVVKDLASPSKDKSEANGGRKDAADNNNNESEDDEYENEDVPICHRTGSDQNPYVLITVSQNALEAHRNHPPKGNPPRYDIIPAPQSGCPGRH